MFQMSFFGCSPGDGFARMKRGICKVQSEFRKVQSEFCKVQSEFCKVQSEFCKVQREIRKAQTGFRGDRTGKMPSACHFVPVYFSVKKNYYTFAIGNDGRHTPQSAQPPQFHASAHADPLADDSLATRRRGG